MHEGKTPLDLALERAGEIDYCDECDYLRVVCGTAYCGISGKLLLPMMFERGLGTGPARRCGKRKEAIDMGLSGADLARLGPAAQRQVLEKLGMTNRPKEAKYHNETDTRGNLKFDSKKEARRYDELLLLLKAGKIRDLRLQVQFTLQESYLTEKGERVRAIKYVADFTYYAPSDREKPINGDDHQWEWDLVVEDVKSRATKTAKYEIKKKLLRERFGLSITEV